MVSFGTVQKKTFPLIETGEYVWTLNDVGEISGDYGDRFQWDFFVAEKDTPTEYFTRSETDDTVRVLRFWTDQEITLGSKQHEWMQALTGRTYGLDDALPDGNDLLSKRMIAYLTHYTPKKGKNAGVPKEDIVAGSAKPFGLPKSRTSNGTAKAAAAPVAETPTLDRDAFIADIKKAIRRAALADVDPTTVEMWKAIALEEMTDQELVDGLKQIQDAIEAMQED